MSDVQATRTAPAQLPTRAAPAAPTPPADDVRAMAEALRSARGRLPNDLAGGPPRLPLGRQAASMARQGDPRDAVLELAARTASDRSLAERQGERQDATQAFATLPPPPPAMAAATAPVPTTPVDPSAFAQMLAELWVRENGRGAKTVKVQFGSDAWPAVGATLMQSADGLLDVTVQLGTPTDTATTHLSDSLANAGLALGDVRFEY